MSSRADRVYRYRQRHRHLAGCTGACGCFALFALSASVHLLFPHAAVLFPFRVFLQPRHSILGTPEEKIQHDSQTLPGHDFVDLYRLALVYQYAFRNRLWPHCQIYVCHRLLHRLGAALVPAQPVRHKSVCLFFLSRSFSSTSTTVISVGSVLLGLQALAVYSLGRFYPFSISLLGREYELFGLPLSLDLVLLSGFFYILGNEIRQASSDKVFSNLWILLGTGGGLVLLTLLFTATN